LPFSSLNLNNYFTPIQATMLQDSIYIIKYNEFLLQKLLIVCIVMIYKIYSALMGCKNPTFEMKKREVYVGVFTPKSPVGT